MPFEMLTFDGGGRKGSMRKRGSRKMERICGCHLTSVRRKGGGSQPAIQCPGSPMKKFVSRENARHMKGSFCADMLKPIR
jgi:hypothetical protein